MRFGSIVAAALALPLSAAYAQAIEVHQTLSVKETPEAVWEKIGAFCAINDWHPAIADCVESEEGGDTFRTLSLEGGGTIKERLTDKTATGYSYEIVESPLPVQNYRSTFSVAAEGDGSVVDWQGSFDAKDAPDADAEGVIAGIYKAGLDQIAASP